MKMVKRKKRTARKTTSAKKLKVSEQQPSSSAAEEDTNPEPIVDEKSLPIEETPIPTAEQREAAEQSPPDEPDINISEDIISNDNNHEPGSPGEFIFAPVVSQLEENGTGGPSTGVLGTDGCGTGDPDTGSSGSGSPGIGSNIIVDLCTPAPSDISIQSTQPPNVSSSSTSNIGDLAISLLSAIVGGAAKAGAAGSGSRSGCDSNHSEGIEVINVDDLPDVPTPESSHGDDVIEITPGNSNGSSRSDSPEIIVNRQVPNRHVVDLTGNVESSYSGNVNVNVDVEDDEDILWSVVSLWPKHQKTTKPTLIPTVEPPPQPESSSSTPTPSQKLNCPICMDDFSQIVKDNRQLMSTSCGHVFCNVCLKAAVDTQKRCPTCRKKQTPKNLHPIFL